MDNFTSFVWNNILNFLLYQKAIVIPTNFQTQCAEIESMLANDVTGIVAALINYKIESAKACNYNIEIDKNDKLERALNAWLKDVNAGYKEMGLLRGISNISGEYFHERWAGSSMCVMKATKWEERTYNGVTLKVPSVVIMVNGASIYTNKTSDDLINKLGDYDYYLDADKKYKLESNRSQEIIIQKPYERMFTNIPVPYLVKNGVLKNFKGISILQDKGDEVITKIIPYLLLLQKGTEQLFLQNKAKYTDSDLNEINKNFKNFTEQYKQNKGKVPTWVTQFDTKMEHVIPDMSKIVGEQLFAQGTRNCLSGLGFIDVLQGVSSTRQASVLNPKPFLTDTRTGVEDFKKMLLELVYTVKDRNSDKIKYFSDNNDIKIINTPLRMDTEDLMEMIRSGYDRGKLSAQTFIESLGFDFEAELERRRDEYNRGVEDDMYPQIIQNQEGNNERIAPTKNRNTVKEEKNEDQGKSKNTPEVLEYKNAELDDNLEEAPYNKLSDLPKAVKKMPEEAQKVWKEAFNSALKEYEDEGTAFKVAWSAANNWLRKNGYKKNEEKEWVKETK